MGAGLRRATLETLCSRGPWITQRRVLEIDDVRKVYAFVQSGVPWSSADGRALVDYGNRQKPRLKKALQIPVVNEGAAVVDYGNRQKPRLKKALQLLRESGLIVYRDAAWHAIGAPS